MRTIKSSLNLQTFEWDFATDGGGLGVYPTKITIPNGATVKSVSMEVLTPVTSAAGSPGFQIGLASDHKKFKTFGGMLVSCSRVCDGYNYYRAILTQAGVTAPVPTVFLNEIGNIVYSYNAIGDYLGTLAGGFPAGERTINLFGGSADTFGLVNFGYYSIYFNSVNDFKFASYQITTIAAGKTATTFDNMLYESNLEIRVKSNSDYKSDGTELLLTLIDQAGSNPITAGRVLFNVEYVIANAN